MTPILVIAKGQIWNYYVHELRRQLNIHNFDTPMICISDEHTKEVFADGIQFLPLLNEWPAHFCKVAMFNPELGERYGRLLYVDLSVVIVGPLDDFLNIDSGVWIGRDLVLEGPSQYLMNYDSRDCEPIWEEFHRDPKYWINKGNMMVPPDFADQTLVNHIPLDEEYTYFQDHFPEQIVDYKRKIKLSRPAWEIPENATIIKFTGRSKPWTCQPRDRWPIHNPRDWFKNMAGK